MTIRKKHPLPILIIAVLFIVYGNNVQAASIIYPQQLLSEKGNTTSKDILRADVFVTLSVKDFRAITGQKITLIQKLFFKTVQNKLKKDLKINPDLMVNDYYDPVEKKFKLDPLWFILGIMIGPLALLFAWTSKQNKVSKKSVYLALPLFVIWFGFAFVF